MGFNSLRGRATTPVGAAVSLQNAPIWSDAHGGEHLSKVIRDSGINYQRFDLIVRDNKVVIERDRTAGK